LARTAQQRIKFAFSSFQYHASAIQLPDICPLAGKRADKMIAIFSR
jgi:hypothetical protein